MRFAWYRIAWTISAILVAAPAWTQPQSGFTQKDRELLIELRVRILEIDKRFEQIDKRFEQIDKRFEDIDRRFAHVEQRITDLRDDMNRRFEQLMHFLYILSGIFTALVVTVIGFAYWDRRTIIREARREAIEWIEQEGAWRRLLDVLREWSEEHPRLAEILKRHHLL